MSSPTEISSRRGRRRHWPGVGASDAATPGGDRTGPAGDAGSPQRHGSATWCGASNRDSGYVPSPAGVTRFDWDWADPGDEADLDTPPSVPRRPPGTHPIAIPEGRGGGGQGLQTPADSALLRRRRRQWRSVSTESSDDERQDDNDEAADNGEPTVQSGNVMRRRGGGDSLPMRRYEDQLFGGNLDETDHQPVVQRGRVEDVKLMDGHPMHMAWSDTALISSGTRPPVYRPAQLRMDGDGAAAVERHIGQELRELADSLRLSRSAPGDLQPRRDIWTMLRRTISFRVGPEAAAPADRVRRQAHNPQQ